MKVRVLKCSSCGKLYVPPSYFCRSCKSEKLEEAEILGRGILYTYSTVYVPLSSLEKEAPYTVAIVDIEGDCKITGRVVESSPDKLSIGAPVEVAEIKDGIYLFKLSRSNS
jgi:uncharacterized OB-fold protein